MRLRRRAVDLVGEQDVRENRPRFEAPLTPARGRILIQEIRARDVRRHEVGGELNPLEVEPEGLGEGTHEQRLCRARQTGHQTVSTDERRDENLFERGVLPDDDGPDGLLERRHRRVEVSYELLRGGGFGH